MAAISLAAICGATLSTSAWAQDTSKVLVVNPGIYHVWFHQEPSQEVVDAFTKAYSQGKAEPQQARVIRAYTVRRDASGDGYRREPVWLLNFHWDRLVAGATAQGIPVYVAVEPGIDMVKANKHVRAAVSGLSQDTRQWIETHAVCGGTHNADENHQRILEVDRGVVSLHPGATVLRMIHSQSALNYFGAYRSLLPQERDALVSAINRGGPSQVLLYDGAFGAPTAELLAQLPLGLRIFGRVAGREPSLAETQLAHADPVYKNGKRYAAWVLSKDPSLFHTLENYDWTFACSGTMVVSELALRDVAGRVGAEQFLSAPQIQEAVGEYVVKQWNYVDKEGDPVQGELQVRPLLGHSDPLAIDLAGKCFGITVPEATPNANRFNPEFSDANFKNHVVADMAGALERGNGIVDGSTATADRIENIPVWNHARGTAEAIAAETVKALNGSDKNTVVLDPVANEPLARQVGDILTKQGYEVRYAADLDDPVRQTVAGRMHTAVVVRLAPSGTGGQTGSPDTGTSPNLATGETDGPEGAPAGIRLRLDPNSLVAFPSDPKTIADVQLRFQGHRTAIARAVERRQTAAEIGQVLDRQIKVNVALDRAQAKLDRKKLVAHILDSIESERTRLTSPRNTRRLIGFLGPWTEATVCRVLGVEPEEMRVVYQSERWVEKRLGNTRFSTAGRKGSDEAFLIYDATGEDESTTLGAVKKTLDKIEKHVGKRGVVLVGNPKDRAYKRLKAAVEADKDLEVAGEVDSRNKSEGEILDEIDEAMRATGAQIAIKAGLSGPGRRDDRGLAPGDGDPRDGGDFDDPDVDVEIEKIDGGWKITYKINGIPIWEVVIDEDGNIICQGPPGSCHSDTQDKLGRPDRFGALTTPDAVLQELRGEDSVIGARQIRWNMLLPPSPGHSGNVLFLPYGQLHEGPGKTGNKEAAYHLYLVDPSTGAYATEAIALDSSRQPLDRVPAAMPNVPSPASLPATIASSLEHAILSGDWQGVRDIVAGSPDSLLSPVVRFPLGHALLALNRLDEAATLFAGATQKPALVAWKQWTEQLADRYPASAAAHYLHGDALARLGRWDEAEAEFTRVLQPEMDPRFYFAKNARGVLYAVQGSYNESLTDLFKVAAENPRFADGHANLGGLWVLQRASEGAIDSYQKALDLNERAALPRIGLAAGLYGSGDWDGALAQLKRAAEYPDPTIFRIASESHLALLARRAELYVTTNPLDLLPKGRPGTQPGASPPPTMSARRTESPPPRSASAFRVGRASPPAVTPYRQPPTPAPHDWAQAHQNYVQEAQRLQQEVRAQQMRWEADLRQQQMNNPIGGITMNMQKAFADRGDWPVGTFFALGYATAPAGRGVLSNPLAPWMQSVPPGNDASQAHQAAATAYRQEGDFARALTELQGAGQPLVVKVVAKEAVLQVGPVAGQKVFRGQALQVSNVKDDWLWVESVAGKKLDTPGWIHRKDVK
ncbi:MAG: tetratricopeptide repeat protein [Planctomycetota bacterium]